MGNELKNGLSQEVCFACGEELGVVLYKPTQSKEPTLRDDLCFSCREVMVGGGVLLIEVVKDRSEERTGLMWKMSKEWKEAGGVKGPVVYIPRKDAIELGLPREGENVG